jgi:hypothetical protein
MQNWFTFYEMIGGAAATLIGLLFVAVSVNAEKILGEAHTHSRLLAEQAFQNYLAVLIVTLFAFLPHMSLNSFGSIVIGATAAWGVWVLVRVFKSLSASAQGTSRVRMFRRYLLTLVGFAMLVYGGWNMAFRKADDHTNVAIGLLMLLISATIVSWELLVSITGEKKFGVRN